MTRIYLDTSAYNRPFDDQTQPKIFLESQTASIGFGDHNWRKSDRWV